MRRGLAPNPGPDAEGLGLPGGMNPAALEAQIHLEFIRNGRRVRISHVDS